MERLARIVSHLEPGAQVQGQAGLERHSTSSQPGKFKVAVLGASGGIGQPLSMLLKLYPQIGELSLYDVVNTPGVAADVSHMDTSAKVSACTGNDELPKALYGCDLVIIPAGVPRKPGMTRDDLFNINAGIVKTLCEGIAKYCPKAWVAIISNPVNSTVPIAAEVFKRAGTYDPRKLLGVTKLDVMRANAFVGEILGANPAEVSVPVVGGHAGITILPLLSQAVPPLSLPTERTKTLMERIQNAGTEVVEAKKGAGSATLSMAYAAAKFGEACLRAMAGERGVVECAYVDSPLLPDMPFFASRLRLGVNGVEEYLPLGHLNPLEQETLHAMKPELLGSIRKGVEFVAAKSSGESSASSAPAPAPSPPIRSPDLGSRVTAGAPEGLLELAGAAGGAASRGNATLGHVQLKPNPTSASEQQQQQQVVPNQAPVRERLAQLVQPVTSVGQQVGEQASKAMSVVGQQAGVLAASVGGQASRTVSSWGQTLSQLVPSAGLGRAASPKPEGLAEEEGGSDEVSNAQEQPKAPETGGGRDLPMSAEETTGGYYASPPEGSKARSGAGSSSGSSNSGSGVNGQPTKEGLPEKAPDTMGAYYSPSAAGAKSGPAVRGAYEGRR